MRIIILAATFLTTLGAVPALAGHGQQGYGNNSGGYGAVDPRCLGERRTARNVGGFLGALGGASAGRALAAAAVRPEGVILGSVVGAIVGASLGNAAVDCTPRELYTQNGGRSYGNHDQSQPVYQQQPVYQFPAYQHQPVYQAPVYQHPIYQSPGFEQPVNQQQVAQSRQYVAGAQWYQPSSHSYFGQERRTIFATSQSSFDHPQYLSQGSYIMSDQQQAVAISQSYQTETSYQAGGSYVSGQQYAPYSSGHVVVESQGVPCGYQICR